VARSIVWRITGDKRRATTAAARMGQGFALLMAGFGLWWISSASSFGGVWLIALAYLLWASCRGALAQAAVDERLDGVRVADIMDSHPVAIPASTPVTEAIDQYFLRYRASWLPVVNESGRLLGIARQERAEGSFAGGEAWLTIAAIIEPDDGPGWRVRDDRPISELLTPGALGKLGALMAVDADGILRGVVTADQVRRALTTAFGRSTA
jgi:CBS domain-containing protein